MWQALQPRLDSHGSAHAPEDGGRPLSVPNVVISEYPSLAGIIDLVLVAGVENLEAIEIP